MAGGERDKTRVYLERVRVLEERARNLAQLSVAIISVAAAVAALTGIPAVRAVLLAVASLFTSLSAIQAISYLAESERIWERLLKDPQRHALLLAAFMVLAAGTMILAVLAALGIWR